MATEEEKMTWLAASYHMPSTYSLRVPTTSINSASALPAPGPGTVRLTLVQRGIEFFGIEYVRDNLFPLIRSARVQIKPPEKVALSLQVMHAFKGNNNGGGVVQSLAYREYAQAEGEITVFLEVPTSAAESFRTILSGVSYWGQSDSLTTCLHVGVKSPIPGEVACPMTAIGKSNRIKQLWTNFVTDFRDEMVTWEEILPSCSREQSDAIRVVLFVFPMRSIESRSARTRLLVRSTID